MHAMRDQLRDEGSSKAVAGGVAWTAVVDGGRRTSVCGSRDNVRYLAKRCS